MTKSISIFIYFLTIFTYPILANEPKVNKQLNNKHNVTDSTSLFIDSLWNELIYVEGGCLSGGQHVNDKKFGGENCIMNNRWKPNESWALFFRLPKSELTPFLIDKFSDTTTTEIHTCPCFNASCGEVAVYALQNIYKINWYDLDEYSIYANKESSGCFDGPQSWLKGILSNPENRLILAKSWNTYLLN